MHRLREAQIVTESLSGRETVCAVARRHGLTPQQLFTWRRQARSGSMASNERLGFASVVVSAAPIEIELGGATMHRRVAMRRRCGR